MIGDFVDTTGKTLFDKISKQSVLAIIKNKTTYSASSQALAEVLIFYDDLREPFYVLKTKTYQAFDIIVKKNRMQVQSAIQKKWKALVIEYKQESSMNNQADFETLVGGFVTEICPMVMLMYSDVKFILAKEDQNVDEVSKNLSASYFDDELLRPLSVIMKLNRNDILSSVKSQMKFWYRIPVIVSIIRFFKGIR
jgi:hypothetical protein